MSRREFTSQKALQAHAEQTDNVCVLEGIALRQRQLSPDQYEIVEVRTSRGVLRTALLMPKAVLKALWEAEATFREALGIKGERKRLRGQRALNPAQMSPSFNDPEHWRDRAEELRRLAEDTKDAATKEMMLRNARDYENLAVRAVERSKRPPKVG